MIHNMSFEELKRETENSDNELAKLLLKNFEDFEDKRVDVSTKEFAEMLVKFKDEIIDSLS